MIKKTITLVVPAGASAGASVDVSAYGAMWFQFIGVTTAGCTVVIEGSNDDTNFAACTASITADGFVEVPQDVWHVRVNRTVAGAGAVTCVGLGLTESP